SPAPSKSTNQLHPLSPSRNKFQKLYKLPLSLPLSRMPSACLLLLLFNVVEIDRLDRSYFLDGNRTILTENKSVLFYCPHREVCCPSSWASPMRIPSGL